VQYVVMNVQKFQHGKLNETHLERAKNNLKKHFSAVGILETLQESESLIGIVLQWGSRPPRKGSIHHGTHHNSLEFIKDISNQAEENDTSTFHLFQWYNAVNLLDIELYNYGIDIFLRQARFNNITIEHEPKKLTLMAPPEFDIGDRKTLQKLLDNYVSTKNCQTTCCSTTCPPIGFYWEATARQLNLIPKPTNCPAKLLDRINQWDISNSIEFGSIRKQSHHHLRPHHQVHF